MGDSSARKAARRNITDIPAADTISAPTHALQAANEALEKFVDDGLLWMVNTSVLHPRGYALGVIRDKETKEPFELVLLGDGSEPWYFLPGEYDEIIQRYERGEERRSLAWDPEVTEDQHGADFV